MAVRHVWHQAHVNAVTTADEEEEPVMTGALYGLARVCARHRFWILAIWVLVTVALVGMSQRLGDATNNSLTLPGSNSQLATDTLSKSFPDQANGTSPIVLHVSSGKLT